MGRNTENKAMNQSTKFIQKLKKETTFAIAKLEER